jgi:hypothetical protein
MNKPFNYYGPYPTKADYDRAFQDARNWAIENPEELPQIAARIYSVKEDALRKSIVRLRHKERNSQGNFNTYGGNNKILSAEQEEAIRQYCYEQWEAGLGATHSMVQGVIKLYGL